MIQATAEEINKKRSNDQDKKKARDEKKSVPDKASEGKTGQQVDALGYILFFFLLCFALVLDLLPYFTAGFATVLDWLLDITFWISVTFAMMLATGDILGSLIGKRQAVNAIQTILEIIPFSDILPWHIIAVVVIFLDLKFGIFDKLFKPKAT